MPDPPKTAPNRNRRFSRPGFELLIVFVGVWGALIAEGIREGRQRRQTAVRIARTIVNELDSTYIGWAIPYADSVSHELAVWREAYERGERPVPYFFRVPGGDERTGSELWEAAVSAGMLQVFNPEVVRQVGQFYTENVGMLNRVGRYQAATERLIFPGLSESTDFFYKPGTAKLKPEFEGHMYLTEELIREWMGRIAWAPGIKTLLVAEINSRR